MSKVYVLKVVDGFDEEPKYSNFNTRSEHVLGIYESYEAAKQAVLRAGKYREEFDDRDYYGGKFLLYFVNEYELNKDDFSIFEERVD